MFKIQKKKKNQINTQYDQCHTMNDKQIIVIKDKSFYTKSVTH